MTTKTCENCKNNFYLDQSDVNFFEKIHVPLPTWCPECQLLRKIIWRNERTLYKRKCDAPSHEEMLVSIYAPDSLIKVYDQKHWWSDEWDANAFGKEYDFSKTFFGQFKELLATVPWPNLVSKNSIQSDYCNSVLDMKNCYLVFGAGGSENTYYSTSIDFAKDSLDLFTGVKNELCYELVNSSECYRVAFTYYSVQCRNSMFLYDCRDCSDCFGCVGLKNKSYHVWNKPYSKEEYENMRNEINTGSYKELEKLKNTFKEHMMRYPKKYARITNSVNVSGDNIKNAKNSYYCFNTLTESLEDSKYVLIPYGKPVKENVSVYITGGMTLAYESASINNGNMILFSKKIWTGHNIQYSLNCHNCANCFGCIGLRNKSYCILNREYAKETYESLVKQIIEHMNNMPYEDRKGRTYKYGEFFPPELSPFAYNETIAQECFTITKDQALKQGFSWRDTEKKQYTVTKSISELPDLISEITDAVLEDVIECSHKSTCTDQCSHAFRIIPQELEFYRKMSLPLPRLCPNCRHYARLTWRNPYKLWHKQCMCDNAPNTEYQNTTKHFHGETSCPNEFETTYSPTRPELVYCGDCYNTECT